MATRFLTKEYQVSNVKTAANVLDCLLNPILTARSEEGV